LNEIDEPELTPVKKLYQAYILTAVWGLINFLVNIIIVSQGKGDGKRIFYSLFAFVLF
jgi:hypothetical protein